MGDAVLDLVGAQCRDYLAEEGDIAQLLTSELVTNAYQHSTEPALLRLRGFGGDRLRVSVWDANPHIPPPFDQRQPGSLSLVPAEAVSGRGLLLVCHYADAWGGYPLGDDLFGRAGKLLWCELGARGVDVAVAAA
ncbi:ATP-binding protein [Streptomyces acidicola]|uniref:ATP-binding protein n=1 Tax=Streptomyces acidicola TaxID=2596892 RepID=UPI002AD57ABA|nr:ATP-binding protein [Streptomyces acidicola]